MNDKNTIGLTSGCFNLLHPGHLYFLNNCKKLCDKLIVLVARDKITSQKRIPVINEEQRKYMLENLKCVDEVYFEDKELPPNNIIRFLEGFKPDFYITNSDNPYLKLYREICNKLEIQIVVMERYTHDGIFNISTTSIIKEIIKQDKEKQNG